MTEALLVARGRMEPAAAAYTDTHIIQVPCVLSYRGVARVPLQLLRARVVSGDIVSLTLHFFGRRLTAAELPAANNADLALDASLVGAYSGELTMGAVAAVGGGFNEKVTYPMADAPIYINTSEQREDSPNDLALTVLAELDANVTLAAGDYIDIELILRGMIP